MRYAPCASVAPGRVDSVSAVETTDAMRFRRIPTVWSFSSVARDDIDHGDMPNGRVRNAMLLSRPEGRAERQNGIAVGIG